MLVGRSPYHLNQYSCASLCDVCVCLSACVCAWKNHLLIDKSLAENLLFSSLNFCSVFGLYNQDVWCSESNNLIRICKHDVEDENGLAKQRDPSVSKNRLRRYANLEYFTVKSVPFIVHMFMAAKHISCSMPATQITIYHRYLYIYTCIWFHFLSGRYNQKSMFRKLRK